MCSSIFFKKAEYFLYKHWSNWEDYFKNMCHEAIYSNVESVLSFTKHKDAQSLSMLRIVDSRGIMQSPPWPYPGPPFALLSHSSCCTHLSQTLGIDRPICLQFPLQKAQKYIEETSKVPFIVNGITGAYFPGGSDGKASTCNAGDPGLIPRSGRSPGEGNGNPLQYSCLENSMDRGDWWATVHGVAKSWTWLSNFTSLHFTSLHFTSCKEVTHEGESATPVPFLATGFSDILGKSWICEA